MGRTFHYIQNDDVLKSFVEFKDSVLRDRAVVIARHGDYSLFLKYISDDELGLELKNTEKQTIIQDRSYKIGDTSAELVSRGTRHACQKMAELSDRDVNRRRLRIWKWHVMDWQKANADRAKDLLEREEKWSDEEITPDEEIVDIETFLHGEYLNLGSTIALIEKHLAGDEVNLERLKKFAINDIMEMTSEDTRDRSLAEAENAQLKDELKKHTYKFTVSVEATDKEHARQALLSYLAGDERIKVQR